MKMIRNQNSIGSAVAINAISKYTNVIFLLIANSILARLISPEDHGIIAIINVFTIFFTTFSDMGLATGVIQNRELSKDDIANIFSFSIFLSLVLCVLFFLLSYPIAYFYSSAVYIRIGHFLSISVLFNAVSMIPNAMLMRQKKFFLVAIRNVSACVISYSVAVIMAFMGFRYYSLVAQSIIYAVYSFVYNYLSTRIKPNKSLGIYSVKKILNYSSYSFGFDFLNYIVRNIDNLLTGKIMGDEELGYYSKAYTLVIYPVNYLTNVISPVLHPILAEHQNDKEYIWEKYMRVYKFLSLVGAYLTILFVFCSKEIVGILYGSQWDRAVECVSLCGISLWFQMTSSSCDSIYKSLGNSKLLFKTARIFVPIQVILIIAGVWSKNIYMLSLLVSISYIIKYFITTNSLTTKGFGNKWYTMYALVWPELLATIISAIILLSFKFDFSEYLILNAIVKGTISLVIFGIIYYFSGQFSYFERK